MDLDAESGPTEFRVASHHQVFPRANVSDLPAVALHAARGSAVLFDLRLQHRGGANRGPVERPLLYVSYTADWFYDVLNFKATQTREWDGYTTARMRKLFRRLDARAWVAQLEALLESHGINLDPLRSQLEHHPSTDLHV